MTVYLAANRRQASPNPHVSLGVGVYEAHRATQLADENLVLRQQEAPWIQKAER
jgi:hypothetical protein